MPDMAPPHNTANLGTQQLRLWLDNVLMGGVCTTEAVTISAETSCHGGRQRYCFR